MYLFVRMLNTSFEYDDFVISPRRTFFVVTTSGNSVEELLVVLFWKCRSERKHSNATAVHNKHGR